VWSVGSPAWGRRPSAGRGCFAGSPHIASAPLLPSRRVRRVTIQPVCVLVVVPKITSV
jgi:hypothetical protein